ncbi:MAG: hypothetical protein OEX83_00145 [Gammaproteobacteria bacterium]|nr:hypothetical protein [Gammaproteobacteria bacterium]
MNNKNILKTGLSSIAIMSSLVMYPAYAHETETRHGAASGNGLNAKVEGGMTATFQASDDNRVDNEGFASFDLVTTIPTRGGEWTIYLEGNTTPGSDHVSTRIGESNGDIGSATDRNGEGRIQVSELHYTTGVGPGSLTVGLVDAGGFLDGSDVANDETAQFLGGTFVNNPTIGFPDYTLGFAYHIDNGEKNPSYTFFLGSSHGLGDNANKSYSQLIDVTKDVDATHEKGVFAAAEVGLPLAGTMVRAGVWTNTSDQDRNDGNGTDENYGLYGVVDGSVGKVKWNMRLGWANDEVASAESFIGFAAEMPVAGMTMGAAIGHVVQSDQVSAGAKDDKNHAEIYLKHDYSDNFSITPSIQFIENSGFDSSNTTFDDSQTIFSMRANYSF